MADVEISGITKRFGENPVIAGVDLNIRSGEFIVLVGPSGCGKSTLLRIIAGLEEPSSGTISISRKIVNDLSPKNREVAMVFQNYALYPHMSVRENMAFSLKLSHVAQIEINSRVQEAAKILSIEEHLDKRPGQLSGGQKQRVAMGRAMVRRPKVFLFDEPLSNLDAQLRVKMRSEISMLHRKLKSTVIYVTHDQVEAMTLADRIAVMNGGVLEQVGPPLEVYHEPKTKFVASFIGTPSMNFLPVSRLPENNVPKEAVTLGFRPEQTRVGAAAKKEDLSLGRWQVRLIEPLGATAHIHLGSETETLIAEMPAEKAPPIDSEIEIHADRHRLFFFNAQGTRIPPRAEKSK